MPAHLLRAVNPGDQRLAECGGISQHKAGLLGVEPHKHAGEDQLAAQRLRG